MTERNADTFVAVVLAAGFGMRLRPLTDLRPKALCPVGNVPLVDIAIEHVRTVTDAVAVNVHAHRAVMEAHLARRPVRVSVEGGGPLGTAGALGRLRGWIDGRATVVHNADAWFGFADDDDIRRRLVDGWDGERMRLLVVPTGSTGAGDFGGWTYAGACVLPWTDVATLPADPSGLYEVRWAEAEREGRLDFAVYDGAWFDTGTPARYLGANLCASGGASVIAPDAVVDEAAEIVRSVVWPGASVSSGERLVEQIRAPGGITVDTR